jgi:type IX secretion system PorP/SprF family membrane protein
MRYTINKKSLIIACISALFICGNFQANAQQDPYYSQFMFNKLTFNPAYTGNNAPDKICATIVVKKQWVTFNGSPFAQNININSPLGKSPHALGFIIENDILGFEKRLNFNLTYAYKIKLANEQSLSLGAAAGIYQVGLAGDKLKPLSALLTGTPDPNVPPSEAVGMKTDFAFGGYYTKQNMGSLNDFYVGLSARHITQPTIEYSSGGSTYNAFKVRNHIYIMTGAEKPLANGAVLIPSIMIRTDLTKWQLELNANYLMNNKIWVGGSYRNDSYRGEALILQGGMKLSPDLKAGVAYDFTLNRLGPLRGNSGGSVEVMIQYCMKIKTKDVGYKQYRDTRRQAGWEL